MVTNKKTKVRLIVETVIFFIVFIGIVAGFAIVFSTMKVQNDIERQQLGTVSGTAVSGSVTAGSSSSDDSTRP